MAPPNPNGIYFNSRYLGEPEDNYVCWLDVMGTHNQMLRSLPISANFVYKLHCAVLESWEEAGYPEDVSLYPVMDGVYITTRTRKSLQDVLGQAMVRFVITFLNEQHLYYRFLVRGAIAYGPVYHGRTLDSRTAYALGDHPEIAQQVLMGLPMAHAYGDERSAPPFGIAVHSSARTFAPFEETPFRFIWLNWYDYCRPNVDTDALYAGLEEYFQYQEAHCNMTGYKPDRIAHHRKLAQECFGPAIPD